LKPPQWYDEPEEPDEDAPCCPACGEQGGYMKANGHMSCCGASRHDLEYLRNED
jgi:hypothetical protein